MDTPQILASRECLSCRGCCLFRDSSSEWSPRLMPDDVTALRKVMPDTSWRHGAGRIMLRPCRDVQRCFFLDEITHHCRAYSSRPFECRLYPFLLSRETDGFKVYVHLSCPAVETFRRAGSWEGHKAAIRDFFFRPDVRSFVRQNAASFPDYSHSSDETEEVCAFDPSEGLWSVRPVVDAALQEHGPLLSSLNFVNMFAWQDFFHFDIRKIDGAACLFASQPAGTFLYWPPLGRNASSTAVDACFDAMKGMNRGGSLTRIENVSAVDLKYFDEKKYCIELRGHEYVYRREDVALLQGGAYKTRRGEVNVFERVHGPGALIRAYKPEDFNSCAELFEQWLDGRLKKHDNDIYRHMLLENRGVHRLVLSYARSLGLVGRVVEVDGRVAGYTFGYALNAQTFCVLFEVTDLSVKGLSAFIFNKFCRDESLRSFMWINAMDDFEAGALGSAKKLWRPARLEPVYAVTMKTGE